MKVMVVTILLLLGPWIYAIEELKSQPVKTVESVDLQRYLGVWYEVASIPAWFQKDCLGNTTAEYSFSEGKLIKVLNSCDSKQGGRKTAEARGKVIDFKTNAKLKVTFVKIIDWVFSFGGDYWILDVAPDYSYAVVGDPSREYAWILSRTPEISDENLLHAEAVLKKQGYDTCKILTSIQAGGFVSRMPICEISNDFMFD